MGGQKKISKLCFICRNRKKYMKLGGRKTDLIVKLSFLTNVDFEFFLSSQPKNSFGLCRPCGKKLNDAFEFVKLIKCRLGKNSNRETVAGAEPDTEVLQDTDAEPDTEVILETYAEPDTNVFLEMDVESGTEVKLETDAEPDTKIPLDTDAEPYTEVLIDTCAVPDAQAFLEMDAESDTKVPLEMDAELDTQVPCLKKSKKPIAHRTKPNDNSLLKKRIKSSTKPKRSSVPWSTTTLKTGSEHSYSSYGRGIKVPDHLFSTAPDRREVSSSRISSVELLKKHFSLDIEGSTGVTEEIAKTIVENEVLLKSVQRRILDMVDNSCSYLSSHDAAYYSVLSRCRSVGNLLQHGEDLLDKIIQEISTRLPFVLDLMTIIVCGRREPKEIKIAPIAAAYAILLNGRCEKLSAWHRVTTMIAMQGHLNDLGLTRLNHMSVTLSPASKLRLLNEATTCMDPPTEQQDSRPKTPPDGKQVTSEVK